MNLLSYILIGIIAVWFVIALIRIVRNRGRSCGCASKNASAACSGCCESCGRCKHNGGTV